MNRTRKALGMAAITVTASGSLAATALAPATASGQWEGIVIEDGVTQPVYDYDEAIEEVVYVEAPMDSDGDGANDLIAVDIIRPAETEDGVTVPTIMEASPYYGRSFNPAPDETKGFPAGGTSTSCRGGTRSLSPRCRVLAARSVVRRPAESRTPSASRPRSTG